MSLVKENGDNLSVNSWLFQDYEVEQQQQQHEGQPQVRANGHKIPPGNAINLKPIKMIPRPTSNTPVSQPPGHVTNTDNKNKNCLIRSKEAIIKGLEKFFFHYGKFVARKPVAFIILSLVLTLAAASGLTYFRKEEKNIKLWIKRDSSSRINTDWLWQNYPPSFRYNSMILEADDNVLRPEVLRAMFRIQQKVHEIETTFGDKWKDMCQPMPIVRPPDASIILGRKRRKRRHLAAWSQNLLLSEIKERIKRQNDDEKEDDEAENEFGLEFGDNFFDGDFFEEEEVVDENPVDDKLFLAEYFSANSYPDPYCDIVDSMELTCFETSILELWGTDGKYEPEAFDELTESDILDKINNVNKSGIFLMDQNFTSYLSGIEYDEAGKIIGAKATIMRWFGKMNGTAAKLNPAPNRAEPVDPRMLEFEGDLLKVLRNTTGYPKGLESYPNAMRSFGDIAGFTILGDVAMFAIGYVIVFTYVMIMLGKFNCVEHRAFVSSMGLFGVVLGLIVSYGLCSYMGLFFGPMHNVLPFLMLGIGIDDMFVIVQCFDNLSEKDKKLKLPDQFGRTMQDAGVAVTITSVTDIIAFGIGGSTVLPALQSFCLYASVGIVAIYWFQCTFFVACMSLDQRRVHSHRNGCCCCYTHKNWTPNKLSQTSLLQTGFHHYAKLLTKWPSKVFVLFLTIVISAFGIWGNVLLEQRFDITWFLPPETYLAKWFVKNKEYFPFGGDRVILYFHQTDYANDFQKLHNLVKTIENQTDIVDDVNAWTNPFISYSNNYLISSKSEKLPELLINETRFHEMLGQFLFSPRGGQYREKFEFDDDLYCGESSPYMILSKVEYQHKIFSGPKEHIPAMNRMMKIIKDANLSGKVFPLSQGYAMWETDEIIAEELYRNMFLAIVCVFLTTLFLISNFFTSLWVLFCVVLSLVDVCGFMHFWGLTIDTVSCNMLIIAIGLCVDYSAHIAHRFMTEQGDRDERVINTLSHIGPAVLNGGFSTFLAFILLAGSKSHVFSTFFKIFFLVVTCGLFHGLVVLPVLLSLAGPPANDPHDVLVVTSQDAYEDDDEEGETQEKNSSDVNTTIA